jgi:hypothetical protein
MSTFEFTRYLYEKEEVIYSLILSILQKKEEESIFWAIELYESGFEQELYNVIWNIYEDFYASLNLSFEHLLLKKIHTMKNEKNPNSLLWIIKNLFLKPSNLDTFSLTKLQNEFEIEKPEETSSSLLENLLENKDFLSITSILLETWIQKPLDEFEKQFQNVLNFYENKAFFPKKKPQSFMKVWQTTKKLLESIKIPWNPQKLLLTRILYFQSLEAKLKIGKTLTLKTPDEEIQKQLHQYKTLEVDLSLQEGKCISQLPAYRILPKARIYTIHPDVSLFPLKRDQPNNNMKEAYFYHWLYYVSFSPIWKKRIELYQGTINHFKKKIDFTNEDQEEEFYKRFGYEPDEQSQECHNKSIQPLIKTTWREWFEKEYQKPKQNKLYTIPNEFLSHF